MTERRDFTRLRLGSRPKGFRAPAKIEVCPECGRKGVRMERTWKPNWKFDYWRRETEWLHSREEVTDGIIRGSRDADSCKTFEPIEEPA